MDKKQFLEALRAELIARGFSNEVVDSEMKTVTSYFEENGISEVEVPLKEMADEIAEMISESQAASIVDRGNETFDESDSASEKSLESSDITKNDEDTTPQVPEEDIVSSNVSIEDEIEEAMRMLDSDTNGHVDFMNQTDKSADTISESLKAEVDQSVSDKAISFEDNSDIKLTDNNISDDDSKSSSGSSGLDGIKVGESTKDIDYLSSDSIDPDDDMVVFTGSKSHADSAHSSHPLQDDINYIVPENDIDEFSPRNIKRKRNNKKISSSKQLTDVSDYDTEEGNNYDSKIDEFVNGYESNKVLFWIVFAVALPIIVALSILMVLIYIGFWIVLALLMIGTIAGLILFVTAGVLISLIGIVYGAIQLIKGSVPVGLFEIGLGLTVGAAVMFISILVYNFAIRLIPFAMKSLAKLLAFAFKKGKDGFISLKGVLDRI